MRRFHRESAYNRSRNKKQGGTPKPPTPQPTRSQPSEGIPAKIRKWSGRTWLIIIGIVTLIGGAGAIYTFLPNVEVSPVPIPADYHDVFSQMYQVHNAGYLSLSDVMYSCQFKHAEIGGGKLHSYETEIENYDTTPRLLAFNFPRGATATIECNIKITSAMSNIDLLVVLFYRFLTIWGVPNSEPHRFLLVKAADKGWQWVPEPISR